MFLDFVIVLVKAGVVLFALLNLAALLTWAERKQSAFMNRIGPNRANVGNITAGGLLHIMADGIKMIAKEDFIPEGAHRVLHTLAQRQRCSRPWWCSRSFPLAMSSSSAGKKFPCRWPI